jgi:hypothetical protein
MLNSDGEQIDLLTQELERVDNVDPVTSTGSIGGGAGQDGATGVVDLSRERTSSLALTIGSDAGTEQEKLLAQPVVNIISSSKISTGSPNNSGRNTPTLTARQRRHLNSSESSIPPPSLTGGKSSPPPSLTAGNPSPPPSLTGGNASPPPSLTRGNASPPSLTGGKLSSSKHHSLT